jgi:hypothetical protein
VGDYFLNNDRYLCKITDSSQEKYSGKMTFHIHVIDTDHYPKIYADELEYFVFKHLGNNEEVVQALYKLNDEEIARRTKYETRTSINFIISDIVLNGISDNKDSGD